MCSCNQVPYPAGGRDLPPLVRPRPPPARRPQGDPEGICSCCYTVPPTSCDHPPPTLAACSAKRPAGGLQAGCWAHGNLQCGFYLASLHFLSGCKRIAELFLNSAQLEKKRDDGK